MFLADTSNVQSTMFVVWWIGVVVAGITIYIVHSKRKATALAAKVDIAKAKQTTATREIALAESQERTQIRIANATEALVDATVLPISVERATITVGHIEEEDTSTPQ